MRDYYFRTWISFLAVLLLAAGCGDDSGSGGDVDASSRVDANNPDIDAPVQTDAPVNNGNAHLLVTEVTVGPTASEYIEIYNPGDQPVLLDDYYLSDDHEYYKLPGAFSGTPNVPLIQLTDFIARFPANSRLDAGAVAVIAMDHDAFLGQFGSAPNFALGGTTDPAILMVDPDPNVPLIGGDPQLTNAGEPAVLFVWDGASDLVQDVDMVQLGQPSEANSLTTKTGEMIDGPDAEDTPTMYKNDAFTIPIAMDGAAGNGLSHKRIAPEGDNEMHDVDGNGLLGDDETTENTALTWDLMADYTAPTPGAVPAELMR